MSSPKTTWTKEEFWSELENFGEESVRVKFATGSWQDDIRFGLVTLWLKSKDDLRAAAESAKRDEREALAIRLAIWANIIAVIAIAIASKEHIPSAISWVMSWFSN